MGGQSGGGSGAVTQPAPQRLVEGGHRHHGRFLARPTVTNPLDAYAGPRRAWWRLRLKEWVGFTLMHPELYSSMIIQDAHYLASSEIYAVVGGRLHQHAVNAGGGSPQLPEQLYGGHCEFAKPGYSIAYDFSENGTHRIRIDIAATKTAPAFHGELILDGERASAALSVSAGLGGAAALYTNKVIFPASGELRVGDTTVVFDGNRDLAILDEHRSFLPYRTAWTWGTFATRTPAGIVGANFAHRRQAPGTPEESCLWTPGGGAEPLADITFTRASSDPSAPITIVSKDGRLDVTFEPAGRKGVKHQLGLFAIDYFQSYGHYRGVVRGIDQTHEIVGVPGVCETFTARL